MMAQYDLDRTSALCYKVIWSTHTHKKNSYVPTSSFFYTFMQLAKNAQLQILLPIKEKKNHSQNGKKLAVTVFID